MIFSTNVIVYCFDPQIHPKTLAIRFGTTWQMRYGSKNYKLREEVRISRLHSEVGRKDARIISAIKKATEQGTQFHVLYVIPDQLVDQYSVLINDYLVIDFELDRDHSDPEPMDVKIRSVSQFKAEAGQKGAHKLIATLDVLRSQPDAE